MNQPAGDMARQGAIGVEDFIRNKISNLRRWKLTSLGKRYPKGGFEFTVMTYNILSQAAADCHLYLYMKCNPQFLCEEYRISKVLPEILKSRSDVVCLQEVEQYVYDQRIRKVFDSNGFGSIFKKRTGNKSDGCAILWRRAKFNLLRHQEVDFKAKGCEYLNRDNVGLIAVLKPRHPQANQTQLHVATTHLLFNPKRGDVKLCQLRLLLAELEKSAFKSVGEHGRLYHPTVLCGDFNFEPHCPLYRFVETGRLDVSGLVAGNMSGQLVGKGKGKKLYGDRLALDRLGIDESGRFTQDLKDGSTSKSMKYSTLERPPEIVSQNSEAANGSKSGLNADWKGVCSTYSRNASGSAGTGTVPSEKYTEFQRDTSPSSSSSESESGAQLFYHDFNFVPAYKYYHYDKKSYPITSMTGNDSNTVDHIFYNVKEKDSTSFVEDKLKLLGTYSLPHSEDIKELGGLPNAHLGSDHLSLMSKFLITFKHR